MQETEKHVASCNLEFLEVKGASALNSAQFCAHGDNIAYVAGSGVIYATISSDGHVESQRLFAANYSLDPVKREKSQNPYNIEPEEQDVERDLFGFPTNSTFYYRGTSIESESAKANLGNKNNEDGSSETSKSHSRVREPICLAISPDCHVLAVGETGYQPRVLLYSLAHNSSNQPFAIIYEHSFGIKRIAFSPDSKYFCSLGIVSDGFLNVWRLFPSSVALRACNKCSSLVNEMIWHDNGTANGIILTLGLRFLKIWSLEKKKKTSLSKVTILKGRNVVLGPYLECNFKHALSHSHDLALVRAENDIFFLYFQNFKIQLVKPCTQEIASMAYDCTSNEVCIFDSNFALHEVKFDELEIEGGTRLIAPPEVSSTSKMSLSFQGPAKENNSQPKTILKTEILNSGRLVYLREGSTIMLVERTTGVRVPLVSQPVTSVSGGKQASTGECLLFSKTGEVVKVTKSGQLSLIVTHDTPNTKPVVNELTAIEKNDETLFLGDKSGQLTIMDVSQKNPVIESIIRSHESSINDLVYFEVDGIPLLCSVSKDRMIQIYHKRDKIWDVLRTIPVHTSNIMAVKYLSPNLYVCSSDRSVSVHSFSSLRSEDKSTDELTNMPQIIISQQKLITFRNTPLSIDVSSELGLVISTNDRSLFLHDITSLERKKAMKIQDENCNYYLCLDSVTLIPNHGMVAYCTDRSLRIFDLPSARQIACVWGHLEPAIKLFYHEGSIMSLGAEGCIYTWKTEFKYESHQVSNDTLLASLDDSPTQLVITRKFSSNSLSNKCVRSLKPSMSSPSFERVSCTEPGWHSPKLSNATLKRIEARKAAEKASTNSVSFKTPVNPFSQEKCSISEPPKKSSDSASKIPRTRFTKKQSITSSISDGLDQGNKCLDTTASVSSLGLDQGSLKEKEMSIAYLSSIKSFIKHNLFSEADKVTIAHELEETLILLDTETHRYEDLLVSYSDKLIEIVQGKVESRESSK